MYVGVDLFRRAVATLVHLRDQGGLRILFSDPDTRGLVQFEIRGATLTASDIESLGLLDPAALREAVNDIADMLGFLVGGATTDDVIAARADSDRLYPEETEESGVAQDKIRIIEEAFDIPTLRVRSEAKRQSRVPVATRFDWEVVRRVADDRWPTRRPQVPLGVLLVSVERVESEVFTADSASEIIFAVDSEDVGYMIDSLTRLKDALTHLEEALPPANALRADEGAKVE